MTCSSRKLVCPNQTKLKSILYSASTAMEEEIVKQIATVKETRKRLELADTIYEYFKKDASNYNDIKDFGCLIGGLANWIRSPSLQV